MLVTELYKNPRKLHTQNSFNTPILFLIFNRPDVTEKVLGQIRKVQPTRLFVAADGPRDSYPEDKEKCRITREKVLNMIDWDCEVKTLFREKNLGCGLAVSQAITWFFEHVEMGIILEDDCYPDLSFFHYCGDLLDYYKNEKKIAHIGGSSFILKNKIKESYFYSIYPHIWGWATWANRWMGFDYNSRFDRLAIKEVVADVCSAIDVQQFWMNKFEQVFISDLFDTWAMKWHFFIWQQKGNAVLPALNLVMNIGSGEYSTHTKNLPRNYRLQKLNSLNFPLKHPDKIEISIRLDNFNFYKFFQEKTTFSNKIRNIAYKHINKETYEFVKRIFGRS